MPCEQYRELERKHKSAMSRFSQFAYTANKHLWGVSERERKRIVKEEKENMTKYSQLMFSHRQGCEECKKS
jgi:hypothetical protein